MGIENAEFHAQLQNRINERAKSLAQRLLGICSVDGREADKNGLCPVCRRVVVAPPSDEEIASLDEEPSPDAVQAAAKKLFFERVERQRQEREEQAKRPEDEPRGRSWTDVVDQHGNVRHW
jgi:hypothetical protein